MKFIDNGLWITSVTEMSDLLSVHFVSSRIHVLKHSISLLQSKIHSNKASSHRSTQISFNSGTLKHQKWLKLSFSMYLVCFNTYGHSKSGSSTEKWPASSIYWPSKLFVDKFTDRSVSRVRTMSVKLIKVKIIFAK